MCRYVYSGRSYAFLASKITYCFALLARHKIALHMKYLFLFITGVLGGILGGMGMGGGTLLIPALTVIFKLQQNFSQTINLLSFIPMASGAIVVHSKNKLISKKGVLLIVISAIVFCIGASFLHKAISDNLQKKLFGAFLLFLAVYQFFVCQKSGNNTANADFDKKVAIKSKKEKRQKNN